MFKKSQKSHKSSLLLLALGMPTHSAVGPLGFNADLDLDTTHEGVFRSVESSYRYGLFDTAAGVDGGGGALGSYFEKGAGTNNLTRRMLQPRLLEVRVMSYMDSFHGG